MGAAKQYHALHPDKSLAIYEARPCLGGTWSEERVYPTLKTNNMLGTFEYPDFPFNPEAFKLQPGKDHIPGEAVNAYFEAYAKAFGIDKYLHFNTKVTVAQHQSETNNGGWVLTLEEAGSNNCTPRNVFARRLIVATGMTSEPILSSFKGQATYGGRIFHPRDFADNFDTTKTAKCATVYGTGKFSWDAAYSYATAGVPVKWVVRCKCCGPGKGANLTNY